MIRITQTEDTSQILDIYNYYIANTIITFEEQVVSFEDMATRIESNQKNLPWLVFENGNKIAGFAYASEWKSRCAYKHSLESTIYLHPNKFGLGIGSKLYAELIQQIKLQGYRAIIGGISLPNPASIALHEKLGFEKIGHFKEVGYKFDNWVDVGYWELLFKTSKNE